VNELKKHNYQVVSISADGASSNMAAMTKGLEGVVFFQDSSHVCLKMFQALINPEKSPVFPESSCSVDTIRQLLPKIQHSKSKVRYLFCAQISSFFSKDLQIFLPLQGNARRSQAKTAKLSSIGVPGARHRSNYSFGVHFVRNLAACFAQCSLWKRVVYAPTNKHSRSLCKNACFFAVYCAVG
jgi:hypothetical protein